MLFGGPHHGKMVATDRRMEWRELVEDAAMAVISFSDLPHAPHRLKIARYVRQTGVLFFDGIE